MSRFRPSLSTILIVLPYILLSAAIWLEYGPVGGLGSLIWPVDFRWPLRAFYLGGAFLGWQVGRPSWFYSWLGFAVFESVFMLLHFSDWLPGAIDVDRHEFVGRLIFYGLPFLALALYLLATLWAGWRRPGSLLGAYTVFPHAALTFPLLMFAFRNSIELYMSWFLAILSSGISAAAALLFWRPPAILVRAGEPVARGVVLCGGVLLAQSTLWIGMGLIYKDEGPNAVRTLNQVASTGLLLLGGAVLLPFLARTLIFLGKLSFKRVFKGASRVRPHSDDKSNCQNLERDGS